MGRSRGCTRNEVVYPGELPVGLYTLLSRGPRSLLVAHRRPGVESPRTCPPHWPTQAPSRGSSVQRGRGCPPGGTPWGSHATVAWAPIHFRPLFAARFRASPRARAGPNTAAVKDEGVGLSGKLSRAQHAVILLPDPRHAAVAASFPCPVCTCQESPTSSCCARRQSEWGQCRPQSGLLTWHPSASTADGLLS